eukprot:1934422-Amphidinium_carterae.2
MSGHSWSFNHSGTVKLTEVIASRLVSPTALTTIELSKVLWRAVHCVEVRACMEWAAPSYRWKSTAQLREVTQKFKAVGDGPSYLTFGKAALKPSPVVPDAFVTRRLSALPEGWSQLSLLCAFLSDAKRSNIGLLILQDQSVLAAIKQLQRTLLVAESEPLGLHSAAGYWQLKRAEPMNIDFSGVWSAAKSY